MALQKSWSCSVHLAPGRSQCIANNVFVCILKEWARSTTALIPPCIPYFSQLEKPIAFVITLWTFTVQRSPFSVAIQSHCGKRKEITDWAKKHTKQFEGKIGSHKNYNTCHNNSQEHSEQHQLTTELNRDCIKVDISFKMKNPIRLLTLMENNYVFTQLQCLKLTATV